MNNTTCISKKNKVHIIMSNHPLRALAFFIYQTKYTYILTFLNYFFF